MKRVSALLAIALMTLVAVLLVRAVTLRSLQVDVPPAPLLDIDPKPIAERLALSIRQRTISSQDPEELPREQFRELHTLLRVSYPRVHAALRRETIGGLTLLFTWPGSDPGLEPILFAAHQDVVPIDPSSEQDWEHPPFRGVVTDGVVWGRGTIDDKASLICLLEAVERLLSEGFRPQRTVYLAFGHDEEVGGDDGAAAVARKLSQQGTRLAWVLDEGGLIARDFVSQVRSPVAVVGIAEKGSVGIALDIEADGGHSSIPPRHTAIGDLASAVTALEANPMPASLDGVTSLFLDTLAPELGFVERIALANRWLFGPLIPLFFSRVPPLDAMIRTTTAVTIFQAGVKENVLPSSARVVANFRIHPNDSVESVTQHVRRTIADERIELQVGVRNAPRAPSRMSPVDTQGYDTIRRTIRAVFPGTVVVPYLVVGGTDARHYDRLSDEVYRFAPFVFGRDSMQLAHGTNEHISIDNLVGGVTFYDRLIRVGAGSGAP